MTSTMGMSADPGPVVPGGGRLRIRHLTSYRYGEPVTASYNEVRLTPRHGFGQIVLDSGVETTPGTRLRRYVDYWGTLVHVFDLQMAHDRLDIVGASIVEAASETSVDAWDPEWAALLDEDIRSTHVEVLAPTPYVPDDEGLAEVARSVAATCRPAQAHLAFTEAIRDTMTYSPGSTGVHTTAVEAWTATSGVCQDFAHVALAMLRAVGVPARYVSGYLHPRPDAPIGETVLGESHAWVEVWNGTGWTGHDPTNGRPAGPDHVAVATGRDYADVAPVRGVYAGGARSTLEVTVEISRLR